MIMSSRFLAIIALLSAVLFSETSNAQLCGPGVASSPTQTMPRTLFRADDFLQKEENFDFQKVAQYRQGRPYAELYVKARYLNIRSDLNFGPIVGTVFKGQTVSIYARQNSWVAIRHKNMGGPLWVHIDYLSASRKGYASVDDLKNRCSIDAMKRMLEDKEPASDCLSVRKFIVWENYPSTKAYKKDLANSNAQAASCEFEFF